MKAVLRPRVSWQDLVIDGTIVATIWGEATVEETDYGSPYFITIRCEGGITGFFQVNEIEWKKEGI